MPYLAHRPNRLIVLCALSRPRLRARRPKYICPACAALFVVFSFLFSVCAPAQGAAAQPLSTPTETYQRAFDIPQAFLQCHLVQSSATENLLDNEPRTSSARHNVRHQRNKQQHDHNAAEDAAGMDKTQEANAQGA